MCFASSFYSLAKQIFGSWDTDHVQGVQLMHQTALDTQGRWDKEHRCWVELRAIPVDWWLFWRTSPAGNVWGLDFWSNMPISNFKTTRCAKISKSGVEIHPNQWHLDDAITKSISNIFGCYKQEIYFIGTLWSIGALILVRIPMFGEGVLIWTQTYSNSGLN